MIQAGHWLLDKLLRVDSSEVLNHTLQPMKLPDPARRLKEIANDMRAEAIDPETGAVDYLSLAASECYEHFSSFTLALPACKPRELGDRSGQIAFWINIYNALILHGIIRYAIDDSIMDDPGFFRRAAYNIGGMRFSADDIEHGVLRGNRRHPYLPFPPFAPGDPRLNLAIEPLDPRIHLALVCGAKSCPLIAFYDGETLEAQLDKAAASFVRGGGVSFDPSTRVLRISKIFSWYKRDFGGRAGVLKLLKEHLAKPEILDALETGRFRLRYQPYDWSVNAVL